MKETMHKENTYANELTNVALRQLNTSYLFKLPRIQQIRKFRALYNNQVQRQLRIRYNVPIPVFAGMIDTLQADLDDDVVLKAAEEDPADWKAVQKFNAFLDKESASMRPGAMWNEKFRDARQEVIMTGRGILKYTAGREKDEKGKEYYCSELDSVTFEDFYFEPKGGGHLESHLFCGQGNIWKPKSEIEDEAGGLYDAKQVRKLLRLEPDQPYKMSDFWTGANADLGNRFESLNLSAESNNYVGEDMFQLCEWVLTHKGQRWYVLFEAFSGTWIRFEKLVDVHSSGYFPWMSFASHKDKKNFASKGFADDLYPIAIVMQDLFNEDLENRKRRNSNARAYDKDMFKDVAALDQAQMGRDRLVPVDTKGGTRRIEQGIYAFETPEITGTVDALRYMEDLAGRNLGVTDLQKGDAGPASKKVGVTYAELSQVSKRLSFEAQPFIEVGQQLGMRVYSGLKDYMREPMSIKVLGENGYEWDVMKRIDLNVKRDFEITVTSKGKQNRQDAVQTEKKFQSLMEVRNQPALNPGINAKMADEQILRNGGWSEAEIALILDANTQASKETVAETSAAIQELMKGKMPAINFNATAYFLQKILDFVKTHQDDQKIAKNYQAFLQYIAQHEAIVQENEIRRAQKDMSAMKKAMMQSGQMPMGGGAAAEPAPMSAAAPMAPTPPTAPKAPVPVMPQ